MSCAAVYLNARQKIAPRGIAVGIRLRTRKRCRRCVFGSERIGIYRQNVACIVIGIRFCILLYGIVLTDKLVQFVVIIAVFATCIFILT